MPEVVTADVAVTGDTDLRPGEPATSTTPAEPATSTAPGEPATSTTPAEPATSAAPAEAVGAPATRALPVVPADGPITRLSDATTSQIAPRAADTLLVVPLGATEQHGPHLPLGTDTAVAHALAIALAQHRPDIVVAPELPFGASGEHADFAGTLSIGTEVTTAVLVELVRSADAFRGVVLVNAHGGNQEALAAACRQSSADGRDVLAFTPSPAMLAATAELHGARVDAHAGWVETSLLLALRPAQVHLERAQPGDLRPLHTVADTLRTEGMAAPAGVAGMATRWCPPTAAPWRRSSPMPMPMPRPIQARCRPAAMVGPSVLRPSRPGRRAAARTAPGPPTRSTPRGRRARRSR